MIFTKKQLTKKKIMIYIIGFISLLLVLRWLWMFFTIPTTQPTVTNGVVDLRDFSNLESSVVSINGEWEYYPNVLIEPDQFDRTKTLPTLVKVPDKLFELSQNKKMKQNEKGTYRVRIKVKPNFSKAYSFYLKGIKSVGSIYINGKRIEAVKTRSENGESSLIYKPLEITADVDTNEIELVIQIQHKKNWNGEISNSIVFGTNEVMKKYLFFTYAMQLVSASILLLHALYVLIIYCLFVRKKEMLYLIGAFLSTMLAILVDDDKLLLYFFPSIGFETWSILIYLSYSSAVLFLAQFTSYISEDFGFGRTNVFQLNKSFWIVYVVFFIFVIIMPQPKWTFILFPIVMLYSTWLFINFVVKGNQNGKQDFVYIILAMISVISSSLWGLIKTYFHLDYPYYPFDLLIGVIIFSSLWFKRFFQSKKQSEALAVELQKIDKTRDEFLSNTSHELRNPLHGILTISESIYVSEKDQLTEESKRNLLLLMKIGRRMSLILNDLLDISKLKAGNIQLHTKPVNIIAVVKNVLEILQFMKEGKQITFNIKVPNDFPYIQADEDRLFQILFNLIHNALMYTKEGEIQITVTEEDGLARISVIDSGIGIHKEALQSIFQPYIQDRSNDQMNTGGIGLGLSICQQLVQLHGGTLSVTSQLGIGSTFSFTVPINQKEIKSIVKSIDIQEVLNLVNVKETQVKEVKNSNNPTILVVDDDSVNVKIVKSMLVTESYNVVTCTSGEAALSLLNQGIWDLVITDVMMPGLSGFELTRKIRERYSITELPIIMLTARSRMEDMQAGYFYGANDYVTKPVEQQELKARVKVLVELRKSVNDRIRLEAAWLQAQIQPHFLFNTLNTIAALSEIDQTKMLHLLEQFGNYLRACFSTQNVNRFVSLKQEIELVQSYLFIEKERFGNRLTINWDTVFHDDIEIPPLILQTLVENAIKHGVLKRPEGGTINIRVHEKNKEIEISIQDDGIGIPKLKLQTLLVSSVDGVSKGIGLVNSDKRLKQLYGKGLEISSVENIGTTVKFTIPKKEISY